MCFILQNEVRTATKMDRTMYYQVTLHVRRTPLHETSILSRTHWTDLVFPF